MNPERDTLVAAHLSLVQAIAGKLKRQLGRSIEFEDLVGYGNKGLIDIRIDAEPLAHLVPGNPFRPTATPRPWIPITSAGIGRAKAWYSSTVSPGKAEMVRSTVSRTSFSSPATARGEKAARTGSRRCWCAGSAREKPCR